MDKQHILDEIRRTAVENSGKPLGEGRFQKHTGIKVSDWHGKYWVRWGDALKEAGFAPNSLQAAYPEDFLLAKLCELIRELGHYPVVGELKLKSYHDKTFPNKNTFRKLGNRRVVVSKIVAYCQQRDMDDIIRLCPIPEVSKNEDNKTINNKNLEIIW